jgi:hypothetical protein
MWSRKSMVIAVLLTATACFAAVSISRNSGSSVRLSFGGLYSERFVVFSASITNRGRRQFVVDGILFEWQSPRGNRGSLYGFSGWNRTLKPGESTVTTACVPVDSHKVRAVSIDDRPSLLQKCLGRAVAWAHVDHYPKFTAWLSSKGLLEDGSFQQHSSDWMVNPAAGKGAPRPVSHSMRLERAVPEQLC